MNLRIKQGDMIMEGDEDYRMVGRDDQIKEFGEIWEKRKRRIVVIHGPKLVGKSTFVKCFFDKYLKCDKAISFDFNRIKTLQDFENELFCNDHFQTGHASDCRRDANKVSRCSNCSRNLQKRIKMFGKERFVFVLDNIESMCDDGKERTMGEKRPYDLIWELYMLDILKDNPNVSLVIVSTMKHTFARWRVQYMELQELDLNSSLSLLCDVAGFDICTDKTDQVLTEIAKLCGGLPLAVINAGLMFHEGTLTPEDILTVLCKLKIQSLSGEMLPTDDQIGSNFLDALSGLSIKNREHLMKLACIIGVSENDVKIISETFDHKEDLSLFKWRVLCPLKNRNLIKYDQASGSVHVANDLLETFLKDIEGALSLFPEGESIKKRIVELVDKLEKEKWRKTDGEENEDSEKHNHGKGDIRIRHSSGEIDTINFRSENEEHAHSKLKKNMEDEFLNLSIESNDRVPVHSISMGSGGENRGITDQTEQISLEDKRQRYQNNEDKHLSNDDNTFDVNENLNSSGSTTMNKEKRQREAEEKKFDTVEYLAEERLEVITDRHTADRRTAVEKVDTDQKKGTTRATANSSQVTAVDARTSNGKCVTEVDENVPQDVCTKCEEIPKFCHLHDGLDLDSVSEPRQICNYSANNHGPSSKPTNIRRNVIYCRNDSVADDLKDRYAAADSSTRSCTKSRILVNGSFSLEGMDTYLGDNLSRQNIGATQQLGTSFSMDGIDTYIGDNFSRLPMGNTEKVSSVSIENHISNNRHRVQETCDPLPENNVQNHLGSSCTSRQEHHFHVNDVQNIPHGFETTDRRQNYLAKSVNTTQDGATVTENNVQRHQHNSSGANNSLISHSPALPLDVASQQNSWQANNSQISLSSALPLDLASIESTTNPPSPNSRYLTRRGPPSTENAPASCQFLKFL